MGTGGDQGRGENDVRVRAESKAEALFTHSSCGAGTSHAAARYSQLRFTNGGKSHAARAHEAHRQCPTSCTTTPLSCRTLRYGIVIQPPSEAGGEHLEAQIMDRNRMASMARDAPMASKGEKVDNPFRGNYYLRSTYVNFPVDRSVTWDAHAIHDKKASGTWHSFKYMLMHSQQHHSAQSSSSVFDKFQCASSSSGSGPSRGFSTSYQHWIKRRTYRPHCMNTATHCPCCALRKEALLCLIRYAAYQSALRRRHQS